jgi:hypothetical protein
MSFELLDGYLLDGKPHKRDVVRSLLALPSAVPGAAPFYEGMRILGERTPDLTLLALRLVMAGRRADDESVVALRGLMDRARAGDAAAREEFARSLRSK